MSDLQCSSYDDLIVWCASSRPVGSGPCSKTKCPRCPDFLGQFEIL